MNKKKSQGVIIGERIDTVSITLRCVFFVIRLALYRTDAGLSMYVFVWKELFLYYNSTRDL